MMSGRDCFSRASEAIMKYGRPLEKSFFERYFKDGSLDNIINELKNFYNEDGRLVHGLESYFRLP
ncbi:hypothetical protein KQI42_03920 [Tissierella sp. MSJ-40]|uniref:Uncharacterized protein n=1 Tax=Tissierella simiarum TaxID=2841534 RepID=A0ABS6E2N4_9FIRM|nr:hypothetical protein [Tissierella simiarum]MBU5437143.1 hypothetical protein [Tissierella simiarum]